ncbi:MAG TPA: tetratricopeptide repeat protein [Patescibacteria group bacterium]|nr:tetratricopeptide repeat protein [Patescibacteria group bacterium]
MKLLVFIIFTVLVGKIVYLLNRKDKKRAATLTAVVVTLLIFLQAFVIYKGATAPDTWCTTVHATDSYPPANLKTSTDYFEQGNYDYDTGNCKQAIEDYTKSINLNSNYPQAFNNRAYTYMRLRDYKNALPDLDRAIALKPDYVQALMNRGDIHNYYFEIDRSKAVVDYEKVVSLVGYTGTSVCGHLFLARHDGWNLGTVIGIPTSLFNCH